MKKIFILSSFLFIFFRQSYGQTTPVEDSINSIIRNSVKSYLANESYTRIPYKDFDEEVTKKINDDIRSRWNSMIAWLVGIGGIVIVILFKILIAQAKETVMKDIKDDLPAKISEAYLQIVDRKIEEKMGLLERRYRDTINALDEKMKALDAQALATKTSLIQNAIYKMKEKPGYTLDEFNQLKGFLSEVEKMNDSRLLSELINDLSYAAYYTKRENEVLSVFDKYKDLPEVDIKENSYINIASGMFYNYASSKDPEIMEKAFRYINKSLQKVSDYGEALGLKMEFLMVNLEKALTEEENKKIRKEVKLLFDQTLLSPYGSKEAYSRFNRVSSNLVEKKYIDMLKSEFKTEMEKLEEASKKQTQAGSKPEDMN